MKGEFKSATGSLYACKSEDRDDPAKPNCYCYTVEGQRNTSRTNSQTCQKLWNTANFKPGQYLASSDSRACVGKNRQPDPSCKCRQTKSCMKVTMPKIKGFGAGTMDFLNSAVDPMNKLNDGSISSADIDAGSLAQKAARMRDLVKNLENQKGNEKFKKAIS